jgi:hypothetical protein
MRIDVDSSCFLETSTHLQETKLKVVVLLSRVDSRVSVLETLGEIDNSQLLVWLFFSVLSPEDACVDVSRKQELLPTSILYLITIY